MIFRLARNLNAKIKGGTLETLPLHEDPLVDWSAQLFEADRLQYILLSNTKTLYSTVLPGRGVTTGSAFIQAATGAIRKVLEYAGKHALSQRFLAPDHASVQIARSLNRTVMGSMNETKKVAIFWLSGRRLSDLEVSRWLNENLLSMLAPSKSVGYGRPMDAFEALCNSRE